MSGAEGDASTAAQLSLPARTDSIDTARQWVVSALRNESSWVSDDLVDRIRLVTSEMVTNAVEAVEPEESVTVVVEIDATSVAVVVANRGRIAELPGPSSDTVMSPGRLAQRGRGLGIIRTLANTVVAEESGGDDDPVLTVRAVFLR